MIKCFYLEPTDRVQRDLRRYVGAKDCPLMPGEYGRHDASTLLDVVYQPLGKDGYERSCAPNFERDHPLWPKACGCGYLFKERDEWQCFTERLYRRTDTGEVMTLRKAPPGAIWDAYWQKPFGVGPDGLSLVVRCPCGTDWHVDGHASNCTIPDDWKQERHHCWVRHGTPPNLTVDKDGVTCQAGAGSIQTPTWHGYLRNGCLVE